MTWNEALDAIAQRMIAIRDTIGAEGILPFCYGGSNGLLTQDTTDAQLFRAFGTSRLARTVCAAPTGAANGALYGKMPGVTYEDYLHARLIVLWGVNPSASGIHLVPFIKEARSRGAMLVVIDPRATSLARQADLHLAPRPGTDLPLALSIHKYLFDRGLAAAAFLDEHARGVEGLRARAEEWSIPRAARTCEIDAADLDRFASLYASSSPAVIRCGWGLERNRNGGSAAAAVMALPAIAGKFGVRGGGFSMSNSAALGIKPAAWMDETPEPATRLVNMNHLGRALLDYDDPPVEMLFVYNCNPLATMPDQNRVLRGLQRENLFTVVYEQVFTDTCRYADVVLPATTFLENYDIAKGYGPISLQLVRPVVEPSGEARPNAEVFSELAGRLGVGEPELETDTLFRVVGRFPNGLGTGLMEHGIVQPPYGGVPVQFVDVFPRTPDNKIDLYPAALVEHTRDRLYVYQPDPETESVPAGAHLARQRENGVVHAGGTPRAGRDAPDAPDRRLRATALDGGSGPRVQRSRRGPVPCGAERRYQAGHRVVAEGPLAPKHVQRLDRERSRARLIDRSGRRRVLQRCTCAGDVAGTALTCSTDADGIRDPQELSMHSGTRLTRNVGPGLQARPLGAG